MMIKINVPGEPVPQGRPRFASRGKFVSTYDPPKSKAYKNDVAAAARDQYAGEPLSGPLICRVAIYRPIQQTGSKRLKADKAAGIVRPVIKGDVDNYFKAVTDPLTGIVWVDDAQIVEAHIAKFYSNDPHVEIYVEQIKEG